jgi:hypothetical protein
MNHIEAKYFALTDEIDNGTLEVRRIDTENIVADMLTKPIVGEIFDVLKNKLLGRESVKG